MKKTNILLITTLALSLAACDSGGKKIVDTKDGAIVTTITGDLYKVVGTEMYEIKKHESGFENGFIKTATQVVPSTNAKINFDVKAKVFNDRTDYIIVGKVVPGTIKNKALADKDILSLNDSTIDGISAITLVYEDADGFSLGSDELPIRGEWSRSVNEAGVITAVEFKGTRVSDKQRARKDATLNVQWRAK